MKLRYIPLWFVLLTSLMACTDNDSNTAFGILERDRVTLLATANEVITAQPIAEGSQVKAGDILVEFNHTKQLAALNKAKAVEQQAQMQLTKLLNGEREEDILAGEANLASANATAHEAELQLSRTQELVAKSLASQRELDNAIAARDLAKAAVEVAQQNLKKLLNGARIEDIQLARATLAAAQADVEYEQTVLAELTVRASRDGILDSLPYNVGERVDEHSVVAILQANSTPYARVYVPEPYKANIIAGKEVMVRIDGVEKEVAGIIRWVSVEPAFTPYRSMSEGDRSRLVYLTEIDLPASTQVLPAGIPVQIKLDSL
ncbi:HlyD family secretion protein [Pseudoalteromonas sp. T1lg22]|uniref:HlyD family secretion protein n=1 Tax=Pseudoalteromonas sp. T1lg22 TaxID=2077096 RepID=UPI000CF66FB2|nr:HlyD family efflux transporter periplasmic adaptor subunit [Pseudoalteromonas sp. T1lg22]